MKTKLLAQVWDKVKKTRVRFASGTVYQTMTDGSIRRISPERPWRGKSERRECIRDRRERRARKALAELRSKIVLA
jgi:hypothetical protein